MKNKNDVLAKKMPFAEKHPRINMLLGIVILIILLILAWFIIKFVFTLSSNGFNWAIKKFEDMSSSTKSLLIPAGVSIIVVIISSIWAKKREFKYLVERDLRDKKEVSYKKFIDMIFDIAQKTKDGKEPVDSNTMNKMFDFSKDLTIWGSDEVIKKWSRYRNYHKGTDKKHILLILEDIMFSIRKDMGHKKTLFRRSKLKQRELLSLFINDTENIK